MIREFRLAMQFCDGSERDRYCNIYLDLIEGKMECRD